MMVSAEHLCFKIVADFIYQINFEERLSADEVPYHTLLFHVILMVKNVVNCLFCHLPRHTLFRVFPYEIAIFTSKLAVFSDNESYIFRSTYDNLSLIVLLSIFKIMRLYQGIPKNKILYNLLYTNFDTHNSSHHHIHFGNYLDIYKNILLNIEYYNY